MAHTIASVRDQLEYRLEDSTNLIFSTSLLDEAIRAALADISNSYGSAQTLDDLDSADETTLEDMDINTLVVGSMAYACRFRLIGKFEEASPVRERPDDLATWATEFMQEFMAQVTGIRLRKFQSSSSGPHDAWDWEEGTDFT